MCGTGILISTDKEQITNETIKTSTKVVPVTSISTTKIVTTAPIITTNIVSTTPITTTTTVTTAVEIIETECEESSDYEETDVYEETYADYGWYTAKWYSGSVGSWGYSGRELISGYSVASPDFPQGTVLQITGGGLDGVYRVDDTGCPSGVIDFFYYYGDVPEHFNYNGVYDIHVSVIE